jgi:hypothetical protein
VIFIVFIIKTIITLFLLLLMFYVYLPCQSGVSALFAASSNGHTATVSWPLFHRADVLAPTQVLICTFC